MFLASLALLLGLDCGQPREPSESPSAHAADTPAPPGEAPAEAPAAAAPSSANPTPQTWDFEDAAAGELPTGFSAPTGRWAVANDDGAPSGARVLAQLAASDGDVFNVALVTQTNARDVDLSVRLRAISGRVDQGGGLVWRARDGDNYYIARYNPLEDNFRVYVVRDGRRRQLASATLGVDHTGWHTLRVVMRDDAITCYLDGAMHLEASDETFPDAGRIGLWTKADAVTRFDALTLAAPEPSE